MVTWLFETVPFVELIFVLSQATCLVFATQVVPSRCSFVLHFLGSVTGVLLPAIVASHMMEFPSFVSHLQVFFVADALQKGSPSTKQIVKLYFPKPALA